MDYQRQYGRNTYGDIHPVRQMCHHVSDRREASELRGSVAFNWAPGHRKLDWGLGMIASVSKGKKKGWRQFYSYSKIGSVVESSSHTSGGPASPAASVQLSPISPAPESRDHAPSSSPPDQVLHGHVSSQRCGQGGLRRSWAHPNRGALASRRSQLPWWTGGKNE
jgi:hypothetical protein